MRPDFKEMTREELESWIDYLETKVDRLETDNEYLKDRIDGFEDWHDRWRNS